MGATPAAGGGRRVSVEPERLTGWLERFAQQHGPTRAQPRWAAEGGPGDAVAVVVTADDGSVAECEVPFPPLTVDQADPCLGLAAHARVDRRVGVLLVRLGGHAAGVFHGSRLVASKVGSTYVQGRTAAGGQSQQRFARRREGQARAAHRAAADVAASVLLPAAANLDAVVVGGSRVAVDAVLDDVRLAPLRNLVVGPLLDVVDPRLKVLKDTPQQFRAVRIRVVDPSGSWRPSAADEETG